MKKKQSFFTARAALAAAMAILCLSVCLCACGCRAEELSSLREFSKPYLGAYECTEAHFGGRDLLKDFPSVVLTLEDGGECVLEAISASGTKRTAKGRYEYGEGSNLLFTASVRGKQYTKKVVYQDGSFVVEQMFAGRKLFLKFEARG